MNAVRILMEGILDYAGLFPPAKPDMGPTVRNYATYREGAESWMLSRLVIPMTRLEEFEQHAEGLLPVSNDPSTDDCWCISALTAPAGEEGFAQDLRVIESFNEAHAARGAGAVLIDTIECRADSAGAIDAALDVLPESIFPYFELDHTTDIRGMAASIAGMDAGAKIRSGGVTPELQPEPGDFAAFILACAGAEIPFKATAGLHHPLRHHAESVGCDQFGFLNVFVGACLAWTNQLEADFLQRVLEARSLDSFTFTEQSIGFEDVTASIDEVEQARERFCHGFGSCSFEEPLDDLVELNLLRRDAAQA